MQLEGGNWTIYHSAYSNNKATTTATTGSACSDLCTIQQGKQCLTGATHAGVAEPGLHSLLLDRAC